MIVRCSTPDPEATCTKNNTASHFPDPEKVPEDFSIPLNYLLESSQDLEAPPLPPRHPVFHNNSPLAHPTAPGVPWTPPRHNLNVKQSGETSLLEGFRSPSFIAKKELAKMTDLNRMEDECDEKLTVFNTLLRRHDPSGLPPVAVQENHKSWSEEISNALTSMAKSVRTMTKSHKAATDVINQWNQHVVESEKKYRDHISATYEVVTSARAPTIPAPTTAAAPPAPETQNSSTRVKTAEVRTSIEAKRVATEGKDLDKEIKRYNYWGDAVTGKRDEGWGLLPQSLSLVNLNTS